MKPHDQLCGIALAADAVLDRWSLLVVRELMTGPKRFSELRRLLSPIVPVLLARKLRGLKDKGLVVQKTDTFSAVERYQLTALGQGLRPVLYAIVRWSRGLFENAPLDSLRGEPHWLLLSIPALLTTHPEKAIDLSFGVGVGDLAMSFALRADGGVDADLTDRLPEASLLTTYQRALLLFAGGVAKPRPKDFGWTGTARAWRALSDQIAAQAQ
jgi:DNA-binding HxlR family transcriptional regulator